MTSDELMIFGWYHNDVLIPSGLKEAQKPPTREIEVPVRLVPNRNRFYVMASQDGAFDSRSEDVEVDYIGLMEPGRLHVIALGVASIKSVCFNSRRPMRRCSVKNCMLVAATKAAKRA